MQFSASIGPLSGIIVLVSCNLLYQPMPPGEMRFKSPFILFNNTMSSIDDNVPHTAQPPSIKFCGAVSLQTPLIIHSNNAFGEPGGNFDSTLLFSFTSTFSFPFIFVQTLPIAIHSVSTDT